MAARLAYHFVCHEMVEAENLPKVKIVKTGAGPAMEDGGVGLIILQGDVGDDGIGNIFNVEDGSAHKENFQGVRGIDVGVGLDLIVKGDTVQA